VLRVGLWSIARVQGWSSCSTVVPARAVERVLYRELALSLARSSLPGLSSSDLSDAVSPLAQILAEKMERQRQDKLKAESRAAVIKANKEAKAGAAPAEPTTEKAHTRRGDAKAAEPSSSTAAVTKGKKAAPATGKAAGKRKAAVVEEEESEELDLLNVSSTDFPDSTTRH
jgi:hypothetical protein